MSQKTLLFLLLLSLVFAQEPANNRCERQCVKIADKIQKEQCLDHCDSIQTVAFVIVLIVGSLFFLICLCCILYSPLRKRIRRYNEKKKRKPVTTGQTIPQFQYKLEQFQGIFTEGNRQFWSFCSVIQANRQEMQWFSLQTQRKSDFQHQITISGQDVYGLFTLDGFFVNTAKGTTVWFEKIYQERPDHLDKGDIMIYELIQNQNGGYQGQWYFVGSRRSGLCYLTMKVEGVHNNQNIGGEQKQGQVNFELISDPESDIQF